MNFTTLFLVLTAAAVYKDVEAAPHHAKTRMCGNCNDVSHPAECTTLERCGLHEICYTREYTDYNGQHMFRMGCESRTVCAVFENAKHIFIIGRRAAGTTPIPRFCFQCCDADECNDKLCDVTSHHVTRRTHHVVTRRHTNPHVTHAKTTQKVTVRAHTTTQLPQPPTTTAVHTQTQSPTPPTRTTKAPQTPATTTVQTQPPTPATTTTKAPPTPSTTTLKTQPSTLPSTSSTTIHVTPSPTPRGPAPTVMDCNFDSNTCTWTQPTSDNFDWARGRDGTKTSGTGPNGDHTGNGYYMYIETSAPQKPNQLAVLDSIRNQFTENYCFQFYYNMNGANIGSLSVYTVDGSTRTKIWSKSGHQGTQWFKGSVVLPIGTFQVQFEGVVGVGYNGDIAIDDIKLTSDMSQCKK